MALVLVGHGESCADIEQLRFASDLFGWVPSDSTVFRTFHELSEQIRSAIEGAMAEVRTKVWCRSSAKAVGTRVILDIDAFLFEVHTENKKEAAPTGKSGYSFHPMSCFANATG